MERLLELTKRHKKIMTEKRILISVYTNASGYLWNLMRDDGGTDLGWSDHNGNCEMSGAFKEYEDALEDAIDLIDKCDLDKFHKETVSSGFHWGNYANHLNNNYRITE